MLRDAMLVLVVAGALAAQAPFDPARDLPGYAASQSGEHRELYDWPPFARLAKQELGAAELAALRQRWTAEQQRVAQRLELIRTDPRHARAWELEKRLRQHPRLAGVDFVVELEHLPFVFFLPRSPDTAPHYGRRIVWRYLPWLQIVAERFAALCTAPEDRRPASISGIAVLGRFAAYSAFERAVPERDVLVGDAFYDPELQLTVTFEEGAMNEREARHAVVHAFVHALQHAAVPIGQSPPLWVAEGLAEYFAAALPSRPEHLLEPIVDRASLDLLLETLADPASRALVGSVAELIAVGGPYSAIEDGVRGRVPDRMLTPRAATLARRVFRAQSALLLHFLLAGDARRPAMQSYLRTTLAGAASAQTLASTLGVTPETLEAEFRQWLTDESGRRIDEPGVQQQAPAAVSPAPAPPAPTFDPAELAFDTASWRLRLAAAIDLAARGRLSQAEGVLRGDGGDGQARLQRERSRLAALGRWREALVSASKDGRSPLDSTATSSAEELFQVGLRRRAFNGAALWIGGYLQALMQAPIAHARGKLRGSDPLSGDLQADLDDYYDVDLRGLGGAASFVATIAAGGALPAEPGACRSALAELAAGLTLYRDHAVVAARRAQLERYARALLWASFDLERNECLGLMADVRRLPDGSVSLHYDFTAPEVLDDFEPGADPFGGGAPQVPVVRPSISAGGGGLTLRGAIALRHVLRLATPLQVRCVGTVVTDGRLQLCVVDDSGGALALTDFGQLLLQDDAGRHAVIGKGLGEIYPGRGYRYELDHDGSKLTAQCDGNAVVPPQRFAPLASAACLLAAHGAEPLRVSELEIRGRIAAGAAATIRERWIHRQLAAMFGGSSGFVQLWHVDPELASWDGKAPPQPSAETVAQWTIWAREQLPRRSPPAPGNARSIDLLPVFPGATWCTVRLLARLRVARAGGARLLLGADDGVRVWLNGNLVLDRPENVVIPIDGVDLPVELVEGVNEVLVQSFQGTAGWGLSLRLIDAEGQPLVVDAQ